MQKLDHLPGPVGRGVDRHILTDVVPVPGRVLHLEVTRHPHEVEQLPDVEEPVLLGVGGEGDVLGDDGREVISHELEAVVPVTQTTTELVFHV